jgi:hypothetical protein
MKLRLIIVILFLALHGAYAQSMLNPGGTGAGATQVINEKRPTSLDPRYIPPIAIPPSQRGNQKRMDPTLQMFMMPGQNTDMDSFIRSRQEEERKKKEQILKGPMSRYREQNIEDILKDKGERYYLESQIMRQYGIDNLPADTADDKHYRETASRRFQIVFFLSLPFGMVISYNVFRLMKHGAPIFNGPETAGQVALALSISTGIATWDYFQWKKLNNSNHKHSPEEDEYIKKDEHSYYLRGIEDRRERNSQASLPLFQVVLPF